MLSFEHFTTNKSSLQALRLTHTLEHSAGRNGTLSTVADISCVSYTPVWPITNSDVSSVQRPKTLFAPWDGLKAQHFWRAADNCSCGSSNSHQWLEAPPQTAGAGALGSCCEKDVVTWKPAQEVALHFLVSLLKWKPHSLQTEKDKASGIFVNRANAIQSCPFVIFELCHYHDHHYIISGIFKAEVDESL